MRNKILFPLLFIAVTRIPFMLNSPLEVGEYWRQCDTESIAVNFTEDRFNLFYPQLNYDGEKPNYVQLELQLLTFLTAMLYSVFGRHFFIPRVIALLFFIGSAGYLYAIIKRYSGGRDAKDGGHFAAAAGTLIYASFPMCIFISRAIMPEALLMFFMLSAYYYFLLWYDGSEKKYLYLSGILTTLAVACKTVAIFIGLAMLILCIKKYGVRFVKQKALWLFAGLALVPYTLFFIFTAQASELPIVYRIGFRRIFSPEFLEIFQPERILKLFGSISSAITPLAFGLFVLCLAGLRKMPVQLAAFAVALLAECFVIVGIIQFPYYVIPLSSAVAVTIAYTLRHMNKPLIYLLCLVFFAVNQYRCLPMYSVKETRWIQDAVNIIERNTDEDDLIVVGTFDPAILSLGRRAGWRANIRYYDFIPQETGKEVAYFRNNGAKYFYVHHQDIYDDGEGSYLAYLNAHFKKTDFGEGHVMYHLDEAD